MHIPEGMPAPNASSVGAAQHCEAAASARWFTSGMARAVLDDEPPEANCAASTLSRALRTRDGPASAKPPAAATEARHETVGPRIPVSD